MKRVFIGDLHGKFDLIPYLRNMYADADEIIIVGDFGLGFSATLDEYVRGYSVKGARPKIRFIRGNHDNLDVCKTFTDGSIQFIPDGHLEDGTLFVGGAWSIDFSYRTPGMDWWPNEELSDYEWDAIFEKLEGHYEGIHTVVTHDCPTRVTHLVLGAGKFIHKTRTGMNLDLLMNRLPNVKTWIFGHYHEYHDFEVRGIRFICLPDKLERTYSHVSCS